MNINSANYLSPIHNFTSTSKKPDQISTPNQQSVHSIANIEYVPLATFDKYSEGYLETLNKPLHAAFRVDGILVAAIFEGDTVVTQPGTLSLDREGSNRFQEVQSKLEKQYGGRLQIEKFSPSDGLTLRHFDNGDIFTAADKEAGWTPNPVMSDQEFKQAWEKVSAYQSLEAIGSLGFKTKT